VTGTGTSRASRERPDAPSRAALPLTEAFLTGARVYRTVPDPEGTTSTGPNVLWITLEDASPRLGCYGDDLAETPNIDRLAADGRRFPNAFSTSPVCAPSRSAAFTGCYQTAIGTHHHRTSETGRRVSETAAERAFSAYEAVPPHYVRLLPEYLRAAGYFCTLRGSTDFQHDTPDSAFHGWEGNEGTPDHWRERDDGRPFFAVFNPDWSHESGMFESGDEAPPETDPAAVDVPPYLPDTPRVRRSVARQYDNLARDDERVGELLAELDAAGVAEDTVVVLWSDHGEGLPRCKRWPYDSGTHVPLIVRFGDITIPCPARASCRLANFTHSSAPVTYESFNSS